jgi:hypothetical protein
VLFFVCASSTCRAVRRVSNVEFRITAVTPGECETCHGREGKVKFICRRDAFDAGTRDALGRSLRKVCQP